ncbi:hypothetical protein EDD21DRAFT_367749 [Dissophora ornata]|nr:hypothetical protein EDD21DRAFT_367749 [Dissophora ornata]
MQIFNGFSAWFPPELDTYKSTWIKHGGQEETLENADIAFVSDHSSFNSDKLKPTMKILRPDWIKDSILGGKRQALKCYKSIFPALQRRDTHSHDENLAEGMEAFSSSKVLSLTPPSRHFYQPEAEIQDLSVTGSSISGSFNAVGERAMPGSKGTTTLRESAAFAAKPGEVLVQTRTIDRGWDEHESLSEHEISDGDRLSLDEGADAAKKTARVAATPDAILLDSISPKIPPLTSPQLGPTKRRLPETITRPLRSPPAVRDTRLHGSYFGSTDSEEEQDDEKSRLSVETVPLPPTMHIHSGSLYQERLNQDSEAESESYWEAENYLELIGARMDRASRRLYTGADPQLHVIEIASTDISLRLKRRRRV